MTPLRCLSACAITLSAADAVSAQGFYQPEILKLDTARVSAEAILDKTSVENSAVRGVPPFSCPAGGSQQDLINGPAFVGFASCGVFNPLDNFIPAVTTTLNTMCVRGDYRVSFSSFPTDLCTGIEIDADALVGWTFKLFAVDAIGMPSGAPVYTASTDPPLSNLSIQRFQFGQTYDNTPGGRPIETYHLTLTGAPSMAANTCYWFGICWDPTVNANPDLADCSWRWAAGTNGDGFVVFDNNPSDDIYAFCSLFPGDLDWVMTFNTIIPDPYGIPCLDASIVAPPTNETCANPIAIACDAETSFCPLLTNPNIDSQHDPPVSCLAGGTGADYLHFTTWYTVQPTSSRIQIEMCQGFNDGWDAAFAVYRENDHADICAELAAAGQSGTVPLTELACSDNYCGNDPSICVNGLTPGETLYIMVGSTDAQNIGEVHFSITCENIPAPDNDNCENASPIFFNFLEWSASAENTSCASIDTNAPACDGTTNATSPGLWYSFVGDGRELFVQTSPTQLAAPGLDVQINAYCGDCNTGLACITGSPSNSSSNNSIDFCTEPGEQYYILVHGLSNTGYYDIVAFQGPACDASGNPDCTNPPCDGDANGDNTIDVNDISYVLFRLGNPPPDGDANSDGVVDVNDISYVLFRLGDSCF